MPEGKTLDAVFLVLSKDFSQHPSGQVVQLWDEQVHDALSEELVEGQMSKD